MSAIAMVMLLISIVTVWGGLVLALLNLRRHPEAEEPELLAREL